MDRGWNSRWIRCKLYRRIISPSGTIGIIIVRCGLPRTLSSYEYSTTPLTAFSLSLSLLLYICPLLPMFSLSPSPPSLSLFLSFSLSLVRHFTTTIKCSCHRQNTRLINEPNKSRLNGFCLNKECLVNCNRSSTTDALITKAIIVTNVKYR